MFQIVEATLIKLKLESMMHSHDTRTKNNTLFSSQNRSSELLHNYLDNTKTTESWEVLLPVKRWIEMHLEMKNKFMSVAFRYYDGVTYKSSSVDVAAPIAKELLGEKYVQIKCQCRIYVDMGCLKGNFS